MGEISFTEFIKHHLGTKKGEIREKESEKILGEHDGYYFYTIGQRRGLDLPGGPWYVCEKDPQKNIVYISHAFAGKDQRRDSFIVENVNWITGIPKKRKLQVKIRHGKNFLDCTLAQKSEDAIAVTISEKDAGITPGQFAVFYDREYCLGGGAIQ